MPASDCHFHVFSTDTAMAGARYVPTYAAPLAAWRSAAGHAGVTHGVVVQPSFLGDDNTQMLSALAAEPTLLRGVAVVSPTVSSAALGAFRSAGVRGVRLNLFGARDDVAALRTLPSAWWSALMDNDLHVELHANAGRVAALASHIPNEMVLVLDHFAKPAAATVDDPTLRALAQRGRAYVKLSGGYRQSSGLLAGALTRALRDALGTQALLWGSDWPCTNFEALADYATLLAQCDAWCAEAQISTSMLAENAQRLYWR